MCRPEDVVVAQREYADVVQDARIVDVVKAVPLIE